MYINITTFNKYYNMLVLNYKIPKDTKQLKLYYEILKDYSEEELYEGITKTIRENKYFPNINEIIVNIPHTDTKFKAWEDVKSEKIDTNSDEYKELEEMLKEFK